MSAVTTPIRLSRFTLSSERSLESVLQVRRSVREYERKPLTRGELAQLLWPAQVLSAIYRYSPDRHEFLLAPDKEASCGARAVCLSAGVALQAADMARVLPGASIAGNFHGKRVAAWTCASVDIRNENTARSAYAMRRAAVAHTSSQRFVSRGCLRARSSPARRAGDEGHLGPTIGYWSTLTVDR